MNDEIILRKANINDKDKIFNLVKDFATSFSPEYSFFSNSFENILHNQDSITLVAERGNLIIGYCLGFVHFTFYANGKVGWIEEVMIDKIFRRMKIGTLLIKEFELWAAENSTKLIGLATRRASDFY